MGTPTVPTGVPGLDTVLAGGLRRGGVYLVAGPPGSGKTVLGHQLGFAEVERQGACIFATVLAESHGRMVLNQQAFGFFDHARVGRDFVYVSGYGTLRDEGPQGLLKLLGREVRERRARLLVLDGLAAVAEHAPEGLALREFLHGLSVHAGLAGCTTVVLSTPGGRLGEADSALVDGVLQLWLEHAGPRVVRGLEVHKLRGAAPRLGRHFFDIDAGGLTVWPRAESLWSEPLERPLDRGARRGFGIPSLDAMLHGGPVARSGTLLLGTPGAGKTLLGLHFLAEGARRGEPGLYWGFAEPAAWLVEKAHGVGLQLGPLVDAGALVLQSRLALEVAPDRLAHELVATVARLGTQRLVVDGLEPFTSTLLDPSRTVRFVTALDVELRRRGVTPVYTQQTTTLFGTDLSSPQRGVEALVDNLMLLRVSELNGRLHRVLSILKMRESGSDPLLRELHVEARGLHVGEPFTGASALLTGQGRRAVAAAAPARRRAKPGSGRKAGGRKAGGRKAAPRRRP